MSVAKTWLMLTMTLHYTQLPNFPREKTAVCLEVALIFNVGQLGNPSTYLEGVL